MASEVIGQAEADEEILTFDVPDDALERAATTLGYIALMLVQGSNRLGVESY
jgi:hypothetical protein